MCAALDGIWPNPLVYIEIVLDLQAFKHINTMEQGTDHNICVQARMQTDLPLHFFFSTWATSFTGSLKRSPHVGQESPSTCLIEFTPCRFST